MSRLSLRSPTLHLILALLTGLGLGLVYSWFISPVTYVDANPAILRTDFKNQYRIVISASYTSTHDLARARARLELLGDIDPAGELGAQAQRMLAAGEPFENARPLAQLASDLKQGFTSLPSIFTPFTNIINTAEVSAPRSSTETQIIMDAITLTPLPTTFEQTPLVPIIASTNTPRPTFTPIPTPGAPFILIEQDTVCDASLQPGLMQFMFIDSRRKQAAGIEIIVTWNQGEDRFFTGFKPELGNGYADFVMQADTIYSVRIVNGGAFVPNLSAPICADPNGMNVLGGLLLTFQQP